MTHNFENNRVLFFSYVGLIIFVLSIQLSLHFLPDLIAKHAAGENLQGEWKSCWLAGGQRSDSCSWEDTKFPGSVAKPQKANPTILLLKKQFRTPTICNLKLNICSLLVGTISDPASVYLNGHLIGTIGRPGAEKSYTQTFPITISVPPEAFLLENDLRIEIVPNYIGNQGLIRGPIHLFTSDTASWISRIIIAQTLALPLISGIILLLLVFVTLLVCAATKVWDGKAHAFLGYCFTMGIYLISLTRLPREVLPPQIGIALHFALRLFTEYFQLNLVMALFDRQMKWVSFAKYYCVCLAFFLLTPAFGSLFGIELPGMSEAARAMYRTSVLLFVVPPILCISLVFGKNADSQRAYRPLAFLYSIVCLMVFSDYLAINGWIEDVYFVRFYPVLVALGYCSALWMSYAQLRQRRETNFAIGELAAQLAHDIRSPLSALGIISDDLRGVPKDQQYILRSAIERIEDIATSLLSTRRSLCMEPTLIANDNKTEVLLLTSLLAEIISEKRLQLRTRNSIELRFEDNKDSRGLFVRISPVEFKRAISNIINNSVEALKTLPGLVQVSVDRSLDKIVITIKDNGIGIPATALDRITRGNVSYGKPGGNGLGLSHAAALVKSLDGHFEISSEENVGTCVALKFKEAPTPSWWLPELKLFPNSPIFIVDDDHATFNLWVKKVQNTLGKNFQSDFSYFSQPEEFLRFWDVSRHKFDRYTALIDYEFFGSSMNGIEMIRKLGTTAGIALVTSRFENTEILSQCSSLHLKLIPKPLIPTFPVTVASIDAVLVDDDPLVRATWQLSARSHDKEIVCLDTVDSDAICLKHFPRNVPIYLDYQLGQGRSGLGIAKKLNELGFTAIFISSGEREISEIKEMPWIAGKLGKHPPWFVTGPS